MLGALVREALGQKVGDETVELTEASIINQCRGVIRRTHSTVRLLSAADLSGARLEEVARHITIFSLGGMERIRRAAEEGEAE